MKKQLIAVLFGGVSPEHAVSCLSAAMVLREIDRTRFDVLPIGILENGRWVLAEVPPEAVADRSWEQRTDLPEVLFSPTRDCSGGFRIDGKVVRPDCMYPVLHGENGEDGTVQGMFRMAGIPFVGSDVTASALCMDKIFTKFVCDRAGILQARFVALTDATDGTQVASGIAEAETNLGYPLFVKPANTGSSVGVSKARNREELTRAIALAASFDKRVLVEEAIDGYEVEVAILGNKELLASGVGQIVPTQEFYSYDAKYNDASSALIFDPDFPAETVAALQNTAKQVYTLLSCKGLSRVDFFLRKSDLAVIFNEINTLPGCTAISMYPKLMERAGISNRDLITRLIELAME